MKRCTMVLVAAALVAALALAGSAQAVTVDWVGGTGTWWLENSWSVDGGTAATAQVALGDRDGWDSNDPGAPADPHIVIGAGGDVWYDVFDATVIPVENSDWRMVQNLPANGGSMTVSGGGKFTLNSSEDQDGEWSTFDADSLTVTGAGSLMKKTFNSTDPRANTPGLSESGGAFIFGSYRGDDGQAIAINVADGGKFEVNGQLHFGWWDRITVGEPQGALDVTMTISDRGQVALTGGDNVDLLAGQSGGLGQNDLVMNRNWDDITGAPAAGAYTINVTGHGGSLSVDHSGITMPIQIGPANIDYDFSTLADLLSYQDLYYGKDRGAAGASIEDVPAGTLQANGSNADPFGDNFAVVGTSGSDGYKVTMVREAGYGGTNVGDITGDGAVNAADAGVMFGNWSTGATPGTTIAEGDIASGALGDGPYPYDDTVNAVDAGAMFAAWTGDPGPADPGTAKVEYDFLTGEIVVSAEGVNNWYIDSASGGLTGDLPVYPNVDNGYRTDNDNQIGETDLGILDPFTDFDLGAVAALGLPEGDLSIWFNAGAGGPLLQGIVERVPEPASVALIALGLCGVLATRRRLPMA